MKEKIRVRNAKLSDLPKLLAIDKEIWPEFPATEEMFRSRIEVFPDGQFVAEINGEIIGSVFSQLVNYIEWENKNFTWNEITDCGTIRRTHASDGDSVYGVGLAVSERFQGIGVPHFLLTEIIRLIIKTNRLYGLLGSRISSYYKHREMPVDIYIKTKKGKSGRLIDPDLTLYQRLGGIPVKLLPNYMDDPESLNYGVLVRWRNPFYNKPFRRADWENF